MYRNVQTIHMCIEYYVHIHEKYVSISTYTHFSISI